MAEIELSVLQRQCLARRIASRPTLAAELDAWAGRRNAAANPIHWSFTIDEARERLGHLYPCIEPVMIG